MTFHGGNRPLNLGALPAALTAREGREVLKLGLRMRFGACFVRRHSNPCPQMVEPMVSLWYKYMDITQDKVPDNFPENGPDKRIRG